VCGFVEVGERIGNKEVCVKDGELLSAEEFFAEDEFAPPRQPPPMRTHSRIRRSSAEIELAMEIHGVSRRQALRLLTQRANNSSRAMAEKNEK